MKRTKRFAALITVASLTMGCAVSAFAANSPATSTTGTPSSEVPVTTSAEPAASAPAASEAAAPAYAGLYYTETTYYNDQKLELGVYPVVNAPRFEMRDAADAVNFAIFDNIWKQYTMFSADNTGSRDGNFFSITYDVAEDGQFSVITINLNYNKKTSEITAVTDTYTYYVDKETYAEMTAAQYETRKAAMAPAAAAEETAAAGEAAAEAAETAAEEPVAAAEEEIPMLGLRSYAASVGYSLAWIAEENAVSIIFGDAPFTKIVVGENKYLVAGVETALESAPVNQDGTVYVPVSFFTEVLGATVTVTADGEYVVTPAVTEVTAEVEATE